MNNYNLTIAIPTKDRYELLYNLLESLDFQSYTNFLVLIIDVSDIFREIDCSIYKLKIEHHRFKYPNLPYQRWEAINKCKTKYIGFLDDDVTLPQNYLDAIMKHLMLPDSSLGGVTGWLEDVPKIKKSKLIRFKRNLSGLSKFRGGLVADFGITIPFIKKPSDICNVDCFQGPSMFFKTKLLTKYGNIPWLYKLYSQKLGRAEDIALSGTIRMSGYNLIMIPQISAYHHHLGGGTAISPGGYKKGVADSYARFKIASIFVKKWNTFALLKILWWMFISHLFLNKNIFKDFSYVLGLFNGIKMIFKDLNKNN